MRLIGILFSPYTFFFLLFFLDRKRKFSIVPYPISYKFFHECHITLKYEIAELINTEVTTNSTLVVNDICMNVNYYMM